MGPSLTTKEKRSLKSRASEHVFLDLYGCERSMPGKTTCLFFPFSGGGGSPPFLVGFERKEIASDFLFFGAGCFLGVWGWGVHEKRRALSCSAMGRHRRFRGFALSKAARLRFAARVTLAAKARSRCSAGSGLRTPGRGKCSVDEPARPPPPPLSLDLLLCLFLYCVGGGGLLLNFVCVGGVKLCVCVWLFFGPGAFVLNSLARREAKRTSGPQVKDSHSMKINHLINPGFHYGTRNQLQP